MPSPPAPRVLIPYRIGLAGDTASVLGFATVPIAKEFFRRLLSQNVPGRPYSLADVQLAQGTRVLMPYDTMSLEEVTVLK